MGTDNNIDRSQLNGLNRFCLLLGRPEPRQHIHPQRETRHALGEIGVVLGRKYRGRAEDRHLSSLAGDLERGADRDLGLAVADIAADQAVHRARRFQIPLHIINRRRLIGCLGVGKGVLHFPLPGSVLAVGVTRGGLTRRIQRNQLACHLLDLTLRLRGCLRPFLPAELINTWGTAL